MKSNSPAGQGSSKPANQHTAKSANPQPKKPKQPKQAKPKQPKRPKPERELPIWVKSIIITLKIIAIPALCLIALYVGLYAGYSVIGGESSGDILKMDTWKHLYDLVFSDV